MIPKKIHFCWLSGDEYPPLIKHCIETWKQILPDYELILWDTHRFDVNSVPWVKEAYEAKKYAFAADYIRLYAVYTEGGIYLDSDVEMLKTFDDLLHNNSFVGFEAATGFIEAAIFGSEAGSVWCQKAMQFYHDKHFQVSADGRIDSGFLAPNVLQAAILSTYPDFPSCPPNEPILIGGEKGICVYPPEYFSPLKYDIEKSRGSANTLSQKYKSNPTTYCIHRFTASWGRQTPMYIRLWDYFKRRYWKQWFSCLR